MTLRPSDSFAFPQQPLPDAAPFPFPSAGLPPAPAPFPAFPATVLPSAAAAPSVDHASALAGVRTTTVRHYGPAWIKALSYAGQSPRTLRGKADVLDKLLWWLERERKFECDAWTVQAFVEYVRCGHEEPGGRWGNSQERQPVSPRTVQLYAVYLKTFFKWLACDPLLAHAVAPQERAGAWMIANLPRPKAPRRIVQPLSSDEIALLLQTALKKSRVPERDLALLWFLVSSGARISEACALKVGSFDLPNGRVEVFGKGGKYRTVVFGVEAGRALSHYWTRYGLSREHPAFCAHYGATLGAALRPDGALKMLKRLNAHAKIQGKRVSPHTLRHSFATLFIQQGNSDRLLQMLLGHSSRDMTDVYVHLADSDASKLRQENTPARAVLESLHKHKRGL